VGHSHDGLRLDTGAGKIRPSLGMSSDSLGISANRGIAGGRSLAGGGGGGGDKQTFPLQENDSGLTPADSPFVKPL
jgi:hypothetical protein